MKRLINSSKFWLSVMGVLAGIVMWKVTMDQTLTLTAMGLFGAGIIGNTGEDMMKAHAQKTPPLVENADTVEINE